MNQQDIENAANDPALCRNIMDSITAYAGKLLTSREAAARIGVSYSTVLRWRRQGWIRSVNVGGGAHRFTEEIVGGLE